MKSRDCSGGAFAAAAFCSNMESMAAQASPLHTPLAVNLQLFIYGGSTRCEMPIQEHTPGTTTGALEQGRQRAAPVSLCIF